MTEKPPEFVNRMHKGEVVTKPRVIDQGDGPKIEGTRITVYTVLDYLRAGRTRRNDLAGVSRPQHSADHRQPKCGEPGIIGGNYSPAECLRLPTRSDVG